MVGRTVHQYQFLEKLGAGGMGEIYRAQDTRLNRFVAIKVLASSTSGDPERRRRFLQEAQSASALNHPNIITIHDIINDADSQFMVMEYVQGKTLVDLIPKGGLRVPQVLKFAVQMADALQTAHAAGIIHRDLKPGNVMATESGLIKILDFGLAKLMDRNPLSQMSAPGDATQTIADAPLTVEGSIIGTVSYMSPEQAQGKKVDARSDVFSMGLVLYEMSTGVRAFSGDSALSTLSSILRDEARAMFEIAPDVPAELEQAISRCLRKNPDDRWQTMKELQQALASLKVDSESGVLYRSRLSGIVVPGAPMTKAAAAPSHSFNLQSAPAAPNSSAQPPSASLPPPPVQNPNQPSYSPAPYSPPPSTAPYPPQQPLSGMGQPNQRPMAPQPPYPMQSAALQNPPSGSQGPGMLAPGPQMTPPRPPQQSGKKSSAGLLIGLGAGALILLGGAGGGAWWWTHRAPVAVDQPVAVIETPPAISPQAAPEPEPAAAIPPGPEANKQVTAAKSVPAAKAKGQPQPPANQAKTVAPPPQPVATPQPVPATPVQPPPPPVVPTQAKAAPSVINVTLPDGMPFTIALSSDVPDTAGAGAPVRFVATREFRVGDALVVAKGAAVTGQIVDAEKKRFIGTSKITIKLLDAEATSGGKFHVRALPGRRADGNYERPLDTGVKQKNKDVAASAGTEYIAYIDGEQTVSVRK